MSDFPLAQLLWIGVLVGLALLSKRLWPTYSRPDVKASRYTRYAIIGTIAVALLAGAGVALLGYLFIGFAFLGHPAGPIDIFYLAIVPGVVVAMLIAGASADTYAFIAGRGGPSLGAAVVSVFGGPILALGFFTAVSIAISFVAFLAAGCEPESPTAAICPATRPGTE